MDAIKFLQTLPDKSVDVVITENPAFAFDPQLFRSVGVEPLEKKIIVLKCGVHFRAEYEPMAKDIFLVDCPGPSDVSFSRVKLKNVPRPIYPLDKNMKYQ